MNFVREIYFNILFSELRKEVAKEKKEKVKFIVTPESFSFNQLQNSELIIKEKLKD